jgi:hypothetical protein
MPHTTIGMLGIAWFLEMVNADTTNAEDERCPTSSYFQTARRECKITQVVNKKANTILAF